MTPAQKEAKRLIELFGDKQAALLFVDFLYEEFKYQGILKSVNYWQQVKTEIENYKQ